MEYIVKQKINNLNQIPAFSLDQSGTHFLSICKSKGKLGILTETGEEFLPFEFDNISVCGFGILQIIQDGKIGLLHICGNAQNGFSVAEHIHCEYDLIDFWHHENYIILRKDNEYQFHCRVYFPKIRLLSDEYDSVIPIDGTYVELLDKNRRMLINGEKGKVVTEDSSYYCVGAYDTECGKVIVEEAMNPARSQLLFVDDYETTTVSFNGDCHPVFFKENENFQHIVSAFVVNTNKGLYVLDEFGDELREQHFTSVKLKTTIHAQNTLTGEHKEIPLLPCYIKKN